MRLFSPLAASPITPIRPQREASVPVWRARVPEVARTGQKVRSRSAEFFKPVPNGGVKPLDLRRTRIWIGWIEPLPGLQRAETDGFRRLSDRAVNGDVLNAVGPRDDDDS